MSVLSLKKITQLPAVEYDDKHILFQPGMLDVWQHDIIAKWLSPIDEYFLAQTCSVFRIICKARGRILIASNLCPYLLHPTDHYHTFERYVWLLTGGTEDWKDKLSDVARHNVKRMLRSAVVMMKLGCLVETPQQAEHLLSLCLSLTIEQNVLSALPLSIASFAGHKSGILTWLLSILRQLQSLDSEHLLIMQILRNQHIPLTTEFVEMVKKDLARYQFIPNNDPYDNPPYIDLFDVWFRCMDSFIDGERTDLMEWWMYSTMIYCPSRLQISRVVYRIAASGSHALLHCLNKLLNLYQEALAPNLQQDFSLEEFVYRAMVPCNFTWFNELMIWIKSYVRPEVYENKDSEIWYYAVDASVRRYPSRVFEKVFEQCYGRKDIIRKLKELLLLPHRFTRVTFLAFMRLIASGDDPLCNDEEYENVIIESVFQFDCVELFTEPSLQTLVTSPSLSFEKVLFNLLSVLKNSKHDEPVRCLEYFLLGHPEFQLLEHPDGRHRLGEKLLTVWEKIGLHDPFPFNFLLEEESFLQFDVVNNKFPASIAMFAKHKLVSLNHALINATFHKRPDLVQYLIQLGAKVNGESLCLLGKDSRPRADLSNQQNPFKSLTTDTRPNHECQYLLHTRTELGKYCQCSYYQELTQARETLKTYC